MAGFFIVVGIIVAVVLALGWLGARADLKSARGEVKATKSERDSWRTRALLAEGHLSAANALLDLRQRQLGRIADAMKPDEV